MIAQPVGSFRFFDDSRASLDSSLAYFGTALVLAADAQVVVDVGCGRGAMVDTDERGSVLQDFRAPGRKVVGIDVDPAAAVNPVVDEYRAIDGGHWPIADGEADLVVCDWVLEHVDSPAHFVAELKRSLRPGGAFLARTVSRKSVLSLGSRMVPNRAHAKWLRRLQPNRQEQDVFPTRYRMNTRAALATALADDFEYALTFRPALDQYLMTWPRVARSVAAIEARLPREWQTVMIVAARRRYEN